MNYQCNILDKPTHSYITQQQYFVQMCLSEVALLFYAPTFFDYVFFLPSLLGWASWVQSVFSLGGKQGCSVPSVSACSQLLSSCVVQGKDQNWEVS